MKPGRPRRALGLTKRQQRAQTLFDLSRLRVEFTRTQNPVFAWEAIADAIDARVPIPPWTIEYLRGAAVEIAELSRSETPKKNQTAKAVYEALGFNGRGRFNPFREIARIAHDVGVAVHVYQFQGRHKHYSWTAIFADVAAEHRKYCDECRSVSAKKVERCWHTHGLTVIPPHIVKRSKSQKLNDILR